MLAMLRITGPFLLVMMTWDALPWPYICMKLPATGGITDDPDERAIPWIDGSLFKCRLLSPAQYGCPGFCLPRLLGRKSEKRSLIWVGMIATAVSP